MFKLFLAVANIKLDKLDKRIGNLDEVIDDAEWAALERADPALAGRFDDLSLALREWQRSDCKERLFELATPAQLSRTALGGRVICNDRALIYEEAPQAYKNVDSVLGSLVGAGLARVICRSKPVLTYKTRGECC